MGYTPPHLNVRAYSGYWYVYPDGAITDDLYIYANPLAAKPNITLLGNDGIELSVATTKTIVFKDVAAPFLTFSRAGTDEKILGNTTNNDIFISPNGTGVLKFGTYTAGAATDSTGYITIKDAAGNTRKLMVQA